MPAVMLDDSVANFLASEMIRSLTGTDLDALVVRCGRNRQSIVKDDTLDVMVLAVVRKSQVQQWLPTLCQQVINNAASYGASLVAACAQARDQWSERATALAPQAPHDPKSALLLFNGSPFADRADQRKDIHDLLNFTGRRVYVVRGEPATGKTHLATFVRHVAGAQADLRHVYLNLAEMSGDLIGPRDVMSALARRMGLNTEGLSADDLAQEARLAEKLCDWFVGQTQAFPPQNVRWVVLVDGVNNPRVGPGAHDLVDRLVVAAARLDLVNTALVMLAMEAAVPVAVAHDVKESRLAHITAADIRAYIVAFAGILSRQLSDEALAVLEAEILQGLTVPYGHDGMSHIRVRLQDLPALLN